MTYRVKFTYAWRICMGLMIAMVFLIAGCRKAAKPHSATIVWNPSPSPVVGYNVYRTSIPGGSVKKLTPLPIMETRFVDTTVEAGLTYSYAVTSVNAKGVESSPSDPVVKKIPEP